MSLQEKFQIITPAPAGPTDKWASLEKVRDTCGNPQPDGDQKFNKMPEGYNICDARTDFVRGFGGDTDVSKDVTKEALTKGFKKITMGAADDQYTGEHVDLFYGDSGGFAERNNYLDRI